MRELHSIEPTSDEAPHEVLHRGHPAKEVDVLGLEILDDLTIS